MRMTAIIPVHNGVHDLALGLEALAASTRPPDEIIVVDDGSTDGSGELARQHGARVIRLDGQPRGPAFARNRGAEMAKGDVLVFLDADVTVRPDSLALAERYLSEHPEIAALFGSYDAHPSARGLVTRYKNLLHHYVHQHSQDRRQNDPDRRRPDRQRQLHYRCFNYGQGVRQQRHSLKNQ